MRDNRHTVVKSCHASGKTFTVGGVLTPWWIDVHPPGEAMVITTAPSYGQVHGVMWKEISRSHRRLRLAGRVLRNDVWVSPDGLEVAIGRRPPDYSEDAIQGYHEKYLLFVIDEAAGVPQWIWDAAENVTTGPHCRVVAIGNPTDATSAFAAKFTSPVWEKLTISAWDTPAFTGESVSQNLLDRLVSRQWVDERHGDWGPNDRRFVSRVEARFPASAADQVIPAEWVELAVQRWYDWQAAGRPERPGRRVYSVDVARGGGDLTATATRQGDVVLSVEVLNTADTMVVADQLASRVASHPTSYAVVDTIGVGAGVYDRLRQRQVPAVPFVASQRTDWKDSTGDYHFRNTRQAAWWNLREALNPHIGRGATLCLPPDELLHEELQAPRWVEKRGDKSGGVIEVEETDAVAARIGRSPDRATAVVQSVWTSPVDGGDVAGYSYDTGQPREPGQVRLAPDDGAYTYDEGDLL